MTIQWNSDTVQEALTCLRRAEQGLHDCLQQSRTVYTALDTANPDGENRVLNEMRERFGACEQRLKDLLESVEDYAKRTRATDARFEEAEQSILHLIESFGGAGGANGERVSWGPGAYAAAPHMRVGIAFMPSWLDDLTQDASMR